MSQIIWVQPSGAIAQTVIIIDQSPKEHADLLISRGDIPADWEVAILGPSQLPDFISFDDLRFDKIAKAVYADIQASRETTAQRLRIQREPLMRSLDIQFQRAIEDGVDTSAIVAEKNRLRYITALVDPCETLDQLRALKVEA